MDNETINFFETINKKDKLETDGQLICMGNGMKGNGGQNKLPDEWSFHQD